VEDVIEDKDIITAILLG